MIKLGIKGNKVISLVVIFCLLRKSIMAEDSLTQKMSKKTGVKSFEGINFKEIIGNEDTKNMAKSEFGKESLLERDSKYPLRNETITNFDRIDELFDPFLSLPLFPFPLSDFKGDTLNRNSSDGEEQVIGNRSSRKSKPFLFIDFAFNVEATPNKNRTNEEKSSRMDESVKIYPEKTLRESESKDISYLLDDDRSFFEDAPLSPQEFFEFLPKPHWLFFDFPFLGKQYKRKTRSKRNKLKPVEERGKRRSLMDIFEKAISRTKREMEKAIPVQEFLRGGERALISEARRGNVLPPDRSKLFQDLNGKWNEKNPAKFNQIDLVHPMSPLLLGKVVKVREIHFRDDFPKSNPKKRKRISSSSGKKEKFGFRESSAEEGKDSLRNVEDHKRVRIGKEYQDAKITNSIALRDNRDMQEQTKRKTSKTNKLGTYNEKIRDYIHTAIPNDEKLKYVDQYYAKRDTAEKKTGFETLKPQQSSFRTERPENDGMGDWENIISSKDEVRKNITQVLGQFFSMVKKFEESKSLYEDNENRENDYIMSPEFRQMDRARSYTKDTMKREIRKREKENEGKLGASPVADLKFLFLTITLPTTIAFTLLLVICIFGLRPRGWLCRKVFQNRNIYIVEEDVEKAKQPGAKQVQIGATDLKKQYPESKETEYDEEFENNDLNDESKITLENIEGVRDKNVREIKT